MKLFLHIGTEKTGSSFLQYTLVQSKSWLIANSIYFPSGGKWDKEMKAGRISAGNGEGLLKALKNHDSNKVKRLLFKFKKEGENNSCDNILITNENLFEYLVKHEQWDLLFQRCDELGIDIQKILLIVRDPVSQALSLYKHRAKSGNVGSIVDWVQSNYNLPYKLREFLGLMNKFPTTCTIRKYQKDSHRLLQFFFQEWLGLQNFPELNSKQVNPSLSLSELTLLRSIREIKPKLVPYLYKELVACPSSKKADDRTFENFAMNYLQYYLANFNHVWEQLNNALPKDEAVNLPDGRPCDPEKRVHLNLSTVQVEILNRFWLNTRKISFKGYFAYQQFLRPKLAKLKWNFLNAIKHYE